MKRRDIFEEKMGSPLLKLVLLAVFDNQPTSGCEVDEVQQAEALSMLRASGFIEECDKRECGWKMKGSTLKGGTEDDMRCAQWMFSRVKLISPSAHEPNWVAWCDDLRKLREIDLRTHRDVCELFDFANKHHFWNSNVLSPVKLRQQWTRLVAEKQKPERYNGRKPTATERILGKEDERAADGQAERDCTKDVQEIRLLARR